MRLQTGVGVTASTYIGMAMAAEAQGFAHDRRFEGRKRQTFTMCIFV